MSKPNAAFVEPGPRRFERQIADLLEAEGYATQLGGYTNDWGVDIFATRGAERLAVQVKMYAGSRPVNRRMIFELHGAAAYFDCTGAAIGTDGRVLADAGLAAVKLGIRVIRPGNPTLTLTEATSSAIVSGTDVVRGGPSDFEQIWQTSIMPLAGRTLTRADGSTNVIVAVDWGGVTRVTSNGRRGHIPIEIFRWAIERIIHRGSVTRDEINGEYVGRASSGVALILAQVVEFEVGGRPITIRLAGSPR